jgi:hypothetical protein
MDAMEAEYDTEQAKAVAREVLDRFIQREGQSGQEYFKV